MANVYVRSGAAGAGTGADWANAYVTLNAALTAKAAGDVFWVAADHTESTAGAVTHTSPGTAANPCFIYCAIHTGSVPPVSADLRTTGAVTCTGNNAMGFVGYAHCRGLIFTAGTGNSASGRIDINTGAEGWWSFDSCKLAIASTSGTPNINVGPTSLFSVAANWYNTTVQFGATTQSIRVSQCRFTWKGTATAIQGATIPAVFFADSNFGATVLLEGVDLVALDSGETIVGAQTGASHFKLKDCKLGASVTVAATPASPGSAETTLIRCDSGDTNYRTEKHTYTGTETTETTIVLTGGASDGTNSFAKKIVTTANAKPLLPFEAIPITFWNETTSAITVTLQGIWGGGAVPNNNDIWLEAEYLGTSGFPLGNFASDGLADPLATAAGQDAGSGTWGGSTTKFKLNVTFTPAEKGPVTLYVKVGAANSTFYIDPKPVVT